MGSPMPIAGLGLAYRIDNVVEAVDTDIQKGDFKRGDLIKGVRFNEPQEEFGKFAPGRWDKLDPDSWAMVFSALQHVTSKNLSLRIERDNKDIEVDVAATEDRTWPALDRGLLLSRDQRLHKADSLLGAIGMGFRDTEQSVMQIYLNLQAIFTGRVSVKSVGGPILIATTAYAIANEDIYRFLRFLGMISVNLAVINFLPIPILDGGHMVFLIYEKLRGAPASENIRAAATYAGLFLILALMAFVWWIDLSRWF
jgi:regulator of sigma E protease